MQQPHEIEFVFAPQEEGGYHVLPGLHTQGDTLEEVTANAREALELRDEGRSYYNAASLDRAVREFEGAYTMTTADFYERYRAGERLDIPHFDQHTWASFHEDILRMTDGAGVARKPVAA